MFLTFNITQLHVRVITMLIGRQSEAHTNFLFGERPFMAGEVEIHFDQTPPEGQSGGTRLKVTHDAVSDASGKPVVQDYERLMCRSSNAGALAAKTVIANGPSRA